MTFYPADYPSSLLPFSASRYLLEEAGSLEGAIAPPSFSSPHLETLMASPFSGQRPARMSAAYGFLAASIGRRLTYAELIA